VSILQRMIGCPADRGRPRPLCAFSNRDVRGDSRIPETRPPKRARTCFRLASARQAPAVGLWRCWGAALISLLLVAGCSTIPQPSPSINLSQPGWKLRQGQALWRRSARAPELAGDIVLALHLDGRSWLQFAKTPLPLLDASRSSQGWQIEFVPEKRSFSGKGVPSARLIWLHLAEALNGIAPPKPLRFEKLADEGSRLENRSSGETLTVYFAP
jgi:hypothetical protein